MSRRYELTDQEWEQIALLLPPENTGKPGRPSKDNRLMLNAMIWLARSGAAWRDLPERYGPWTSVYSRFRKWIEDGILDNIFRVLSLEAELGDLSIDATLKPWFCHQSPMRHRDLPQQVYKYSDPLQTGLPPLQAIPNKIHLPSPEPKFHLFQQPYD